MFSTHENRLRITIQCGVSYENKITPRGRERVMSRKKRLFAVYCAVMLFLLLFGRRSWYSGADYLENLKWHINLLPLHTVRQMLWAARYRAERYGDTSLIWFAVKNLGGNLLLFVPLGSFLPSLWRGQRRFWKCLLTVTGLICVVELVQLVTTLGSLDVDDLLFNVAGSAIGYGLWRLQHV